MLTLDLAEFMIELKEGAIKNVGGKNSAATAKLYDVESAKARAFGDERIKLAFADDEGNEVEVALFPEEAEAVATEIEAVDLDDIR